MCKFCNSFKEFYEATDMPFILIEAEKAETLLKNTNISRLEKGKYDVKRTTNVVHSVDGKEKNLRKIEWTNRSDKFNTENRTHAGWITYDPSNNMIYELWCDCNDWAYRLWAVYNSEGMSPWDVGKYERRNILRQKAGGFLHHNKQKPKYSWTNKEGNEFLCKHLVNIVWFYILGKFKTDSGEFPIKTKEAEKSKDIKKPSEVKSKIENTKDIKKEPIEKEKKIKEPEVKIAPKSVAPIKTTKEKEKPDNKKKTISNVKPIEKSKQKEEKPKSIPNI